MTPRTLFQFAGRELHLPRLPDAVLILIDYQNEYLGSPLRLDGVEEAVARAAELLSAARSAGSRIVHVAHRGAPGGLFDRAADRGAFISALRPLAGEAVVEKTRPNGFSDTDLAEKIGPLGTPNLVAGFMTHNCVSSTVRAALDLGYAITVAGDACATRDIPSKDGVMPATTIQAAELADLPTAMPSSPPLRNSPLAEACRHAALPVVRFLEQVLSHEGEEDRDLRCGVAAGGQRCGRRCVGVH